MFKHAGLFAVAMTILVAESGLAQPPRGGGDGLGGGRGNRAAFLVNRMVNIEQILGYLAFEEKIALNNDQLLEVREALMGIHAKRAEVRQEIQDSGGDVQEARQKVMLLAREMNQMVSGVLDEKQTDEYKAYMKRMQERMQRGGGGRPGGRQGGGRQRGERGG